MMRRKASAKSDAVGLLERLSPEEAVAVLHRLLDKHAELRSEAEQFATKLVFSSSVEDISEDAHYRVTSIDLDDLNGRAGAHSWGYVGPDQAAQDLLEEARTLIGTPDFREWAMRTARTKASHSDARPAPQYRSWAFSKWARACQMV